MMTAIAIIYGLTLLFLMTGALFSVRSDWVIKLNAKLGLLMWIIGAIRDYIIGPAFFVWSIAVLFIKRDDVAIIIDRRPIMVAIGAGLLIFSFIMRRYVRWVYTRMALYIEKSGREEPSEYFERFYSYFGPVRDGREPSADRITLDFTVSVVPQKTLIPGLCGLLDTFIICRTILAALKWRGADYVEHIYNNIILVWARRALELARGKLEIEGLEKLGGLKGKVIFAFNHRSFFDFAVGSLITALAKPQDRKRFSIKYLAAKDHFRDSFFFYRLIGLGRAIEALGMIFVERKKKKDDAVRVVDTAIDAMISRPIDIGIYPQGTRAKPYFTPEGARYDAGYYTTGETHLRKGVAHLAIGLAKKMPHTQVHIVPVAIMGTAVVCPKHHLKIQTGAAMKVVIGDPIVARAHGDVGLIMTAIDNALKDMLAIHADLENRFFRDVRAWFSNWNLEYIAVAMKAHRGEDYLVYTILDYIYSLPYTKWRDGLGELSNLFVEDKEREAFVELKKRMI